MSPQAPSWYNVGTWSTCEFECLLFRSEEEEEKEGEREEERES